MTFYDKFCQLENCGLLVKFHTTVPSVVRYVCPSPLGPLVGGPIEFEFGFTW